jgi:glutathione S-transferase
MAIGPVTKPTLYVCHVDTKLPLLHPCAKAHKALSKAGVDHDKIIHAQGQPFGIGADGKRPDLKELSGQEKLPVLQLPGGEVIAGTGKIIGWAKAQA